MLQSRALPGTIQLFNEGYIPPKTRIELHVHLTGAARHDTLFELMTEKGIEKPGNGTLPDFVRALTVQRPHDLRHFLNAFKIFTPAFAGKTEQQCYSHIRKKVSLIEIDR